jgi:peptide deformylase
LVLPIVAYGHPVLRKLAEPVKKDHPGLDDLVADMWETMYASNGVGLAAPQVNRSLRIFVVDTMQMFNAMEEEEKQEYPDQPGIRSVFINAGLIDTGGEKWPYNEGCLSIPKIREDISRYEKVTLHYRDETFAEHTRTFHGLSARVILHEYDHIEGKLFIDHLSPFKRKILRGKLNDISNGKVEMDYKMLYP